MSSSQSRGEARLPASSAAQAVPPVKSTYIRPRARQRVHKEPPALAVPNINEDAAERKRVLNVLAQRRYRERKRNKASSSAAGTQENGSSREYGEPLPDEPHALPDASSEETGTQINQSSELDVFQSVPDGADVDLSPAFSPRLLQQAVEDLLAQDLHLPEFDIDMQVLQAQATNVIPVSSLSLSSSSSSSSPSSGSLGEPSATCPSMFLETLSTGSASSFSADSYLLPVPELALVRALLRIADRLGIRHTVWDLSASSPFCPSPDSDAAPDALGPAAVTAVAMSPGGTMVPPAWQPTASQRRVPHHPLLDLLPWPAARDRVIALFDLPEEARPDAARGPLALVRFAYDLEDAAEGMRIWGGDPYDAAGWEVGQVAFERWWFIFDRAIVEQSNRWREMRGAQRLRVGR